MMFWTTTIQSLTPAYFVDELYTRTFSDDAFFTLKIINILKRLLQLLLFVIIYGTEIFKIIFFISEGKGNVLRIMNIIELKIIKTFVQWLKDTCTRWTWNITFFFLSTIPSLKLYFALAIVLLFSVTLIKGNIWGKCAGLTVNEYVFEFSQIPGALTVKKWIIW